jgi:hypothetical protein
MITNEMSILKKSIFYIISSILLPLLVAEVALRVYDYFSPSHFFFHTQKARHKRYRPPGHSMHYNFRLNSDGFNDEEFSESKSPNTHRIVCIGDSFVYGIVPNENNFITVFEKTINSIMSNKIEAYNMGVVGIGPVEYLTIFAEEAMRYRPDEVFIFLYIGNDIVQSYKRKTYSYSYLASLYYYFREVYKFYKGKMKGRLWVGDIEYSEEDSNKPEDMNYIKKTQGWFIDPLFHFSSLRELKQQVKNTVYYIDRMKTISDKKGIVLKVFIIPDKIQFDRDLQKQLIANDKLSNDEYDFYQPNGLLHEGLTSLNISYFDFYASFKQEYYVKKLYRHNDIHWNIAGNEFATQKLIHEYINH